MELMKKEIELCIEKHKKIKFSYHLASPAIFHARESDRHDDSPHPLVEETLTEISAPSTFNARVLPTLLSL